MGHFQCRPTWLSSPCSKRCIGSGNRLLWRAQYQRLSPREVRAFRRGIVWRQRVGSRLPSEAALLFGFCVALWLGIVLWALWVRW